ncbi:MAG: WD40 repeat domain-containing protein [Planctomycetota bacterium]|nr:WD40 repeat domain-containing protein [Planctomycetota bacterium]
MAEEFDPYYKWLGIPPSEQPPNYYRLLGIELFETDLEVIESAADQRMAHLRTFQGGKNSQLSQRLLNEVSKARVCLLKPDVKQIYDDSLGLDDPAKVDSPDQPPIQITRSDQTKNRNPILLPLVIALGLVVTGGGTLIGFLVSNKKENEQVAQYEGEPEESSKNNEEGQPDPADGKNKSSVTGGDLAPKKEIEEKTGQNKKKKKKTDDSPPWKEEPDNTNSSDSEKKTSKVKKDPSGEKPKEKSDTPPKKDDDAPIIIETKKKKTNRKVVREPLPSAERWKPFISPLKKDFDIREEMTRDARHALFNDLIKNGSSEIRADRAYAIFNLALEQARQLDHVTGVEPYCLAFCKRFEFEQLDAEVAYLKGIFAQVESKPRIAQLINESHKKIQRLERDQKFGMAASLLGAILELSEKPAGKDINREHFEIWLKADLYRQKILDNLEPLKQASKKNELTPAQHQIMGTYECFINNNVEIGFEHYAQCDYKPIADIAKKAKQVDVSNVHSIAEIADPWWVLSTKVEDEEYLFRMRSKYWYDQYTKLVIGNEISRKIQKRIEEATIGLGLKRLSAPRSPSQVVFLDLERELTPGATTDPAAIHCVGNNLLAILANESTTQGTGTSLRVVEIDSQNEIFRYSGSGFVDHRIITAMNQLAWLNPRAGIVTVGSGELNRKSPSASTRFSTREPVRAFDIGVKGDVFALADKFIYAWNAQQAWSNNSSSKLKPIKFESPAAFIPSRIRIIPNSTMIALSDSKNLIRVSLPSMNVNDLHTGKPLQDYDIAANGSAYVLGLQNGLRYRSFKGGKDLFFETNEVVQVAFLPDPRFIVSLHEDHSLRIWDAFEKNNDYLVTRFDAVEYKPTHFAVLKDGSGLAVTDSTTRVRFLSLFYE